jgi:DNA polymerase-3 subunit delta'
VAETETAEMTGVEVPRYPWHAGLWGALTARHDRLPHAVLLHGQPGVGKRALALRLARALLCVQTVPAEAGGIDACGRCKSCELFVAGTHPDFLLVEPAEPGKPVTVDQIRALIERLSMRPHTSARQVVVIQPAEAMNLNAAASLLKVLEEPTPGCHFLLVADRPARLPVTVRSRCTHVLVKPPAREEASDWLKTATGLAEEADTLLALAGGGPLLALDYAQSGFSEQRRRMLRDAEDLACGRADPVACAGQWASYDVERALDWLYGLTTDLVKTVSGSREEETLVNREASDLCKIINFNIKELYNFIDVISEAKRHLPGPLDAQLMLEAVLIQWCRVTGAASKM